MAKDTIHAIHEIAPPICLHCGKEISPSRNSLFCGPICCRRNRRGIPLNKECLTCSSSIPWVGKSRSKYCSVECRLESRRQQWRDFAEGVRSTQDGKKRHIEANQRYIERNRKSVRSYYRKRRADNPDFAMACAARSMLNKVMTRANLRKDATCKEILGYSGSDLRKHLERQFPKGMTWEKRGAWHIDHIVPVAEFLRRGETNPAVINALSNLRPMWARDNIIKRDSLVVLL